MRCQLVYSVVIFSHRFLDSDCINFKTFAFLAVYWPFWTSLYSTDIKVQQFFNRSSTIKVLVNVLHAALSGGTVLIYVMSQQYNGLMELYTLLRHASNQKDRTKWQLNKFKVILLFRVSSLFVTCNDLYRQDYRQSNNSEIRQYSRITMKELNNGHYYNICVQVKL